jgi:hypothetical protein
VFFGHYAVNFLIFLLRNNTSASILLAMLIAARYASTFFIYSSIANPPRRCVTHHGAIFSLSVVSKLFAANGTHKVPRGSMLHHMGMGVPPLRFAHLGAELFLSPMLHLRERRATLEADILPLCWMAGHIGFDRVDGQLGDCCNAFVPHPAFLQDSNGSDIVFCHGENTSSDASQRKAQQFVPPKKQK